MSKSEQIIVQLFSHTFAAMGQDISKSITPPPLSLTDCVVDGKIDLPRYMYYQKRTYGINIDSQFMSMSTTKKRHQDHDGNCTPKKRRKRSVKRHKLIVRDEEGKLREFRPKDTLWYRLYVLNGNYNDRMAKKFRLRFRMPFESFISLYNEIKGHDLFS